MKIAVLGGGGAMGGLFGGYLARAGEDVVLVDVSHASVDAINRDGLAIEEKDGSTRRSASRLRRSQAISARSISSSISSNATTPRRRSRPRRRCSARIRDPDASERLGQCGPDCGGGGQIARDGRAHLSFWDAARPRPRQAFGNWNDPRGRARRLVSRRGFEAAVAAFRKAGIETNSSSRIIDEIWKKLALNVCTLPTSALLHFPAHELIQHEGTIALMEGLLAEVVAVAKAQGINLDQAERWQAITGLLKQAIGARASMLAGCGSEPADGDRRRQWSDRRGRQAALRADAVQRRHGLDGEEPARKISCGGPAALIRTL